MKNIYIFAVNRNEKKYIDSSLYCELQLVLRYANHCYRNQPIVFPDGQRHRNPYHVKLLALAFSLLLLWQLVGAFLYMVRDVACFRDKSTAYQCKTDAAFPFSEDVTMVWLASLCIFTAISIAALQNVPQFPGYKAILHQLKYVLSFWTLMILLTVRKARRFYIPKNW